MNTENLWPLNQDNRFKPNQPVYVFCNISSLASQNMTIEWYDNVRNQLFPPETRLVDADDGDPFRLVTYRQIKKQGNYLVVLNSSNGITVAQFEFVISE